MKSRGKSKPPCCMRKKNINQLNLKIEDPELFHVKYLGKCIFHAPRNPYTAVRHHDTKNFNHKFSEILQRIPSSSLLFTRTVILSTVHGVTASQLLWRIQQYTLKLKSYTFSSSYFLISFLPKPKEIPRNRNTKKNPKTPIYNSTPHNSK